MALRCPQRQHVDTAATPWTRYNHVIEKKHVSSRVMLGIFHEIIMAFVLYRKAS